MGSASVDRASVDSPGVDRAGVDSTGVGSTGVWAVRCGHSAGVDTVQCGQYSVDSTVCSGLDTTELSRAAPDPAHRKGCELLQVETERRSPHCPSVFCPRTAAPERCRARSTLVI